ncbi:hypothetical protein Tco_1068668 [Tanacetum coccineum]|uniref:Uncharacterized protein n=1 Tax=Tanacetum coccineum TaxID=301880 RepID=A0ABQ5HHU3_9ASTR
MLSKELRKSTRATEQMRYDKGVESTSFVGSKQIAVTGEVCNSRICYRVANGFVSLMILTHECGLKASWMMPIWDPLRSSSYSDCTSVVGCSLTDHIDVTLFSDGEDGYSHGKASTKGRHSKHKSKKRHGYIHTYAHVTTYVQIVCTMDFL